MGYVEKNLTDGEVIIYEAEISLAVFVRTILILALLVWLSSMVHTIVVVLAVLVSLYIIFRIAIIILTTEYAVTNKRIIAKRGLIVRHTMEILLGKVESVTISQSIDGRIFNFGTVSVTGSGGTQESFKSIQQPYELQKFINTQITELTK